MNLPPLNITMEMIAAYAASEYISEHAMDLLHEERLATWKRVNDTLMAALAYQRDMLTARAKETLAYVSAN